MRSTLYLLLVAYLSIGRAVIPPDCPYVSPCTCSSTTNGFQIDCYGNHFINGDGIRRILHQDFPADFDYIYLHQIAFPLPADLVGNKTVNQFHLACVKDQNNPNSVDPAAFAQVSAGGIHLLGCDLRSQSLDFLGSFQSLTLVEFYDVLTEENQTIPRISGLEEVKIEASNLASWGPLDNTPELKWVSIMSATPGKVMSLLDSFVHYELEYLYLEYNSLQVVPKHLSRFKKLKELYLGWNDIRVLFPGSMNFSVTPVLIDLTDNPIQFVLPGTFSGNFSQTNLILSHNKLEVMMEEAFTPVLEQMFQAPGNITCDSYDFVCDCSIAWLIRDNRHFLDDVIGAKCNNGTQFEQLDPSSFADCPVKTTTTTTTTTTKTTTVNTETTTESAAITSTVSAVLIFFAAVWARVL